MAELADMIKNEADNAPIPSGRIQNRRAEDHVSLVVVVLVVEFSERSVPNCRLRDCLTRANPQDCVLQSEGVRFDGEYRESKLVGGKMLIESVNATC